MSKNKKNLLIAGGIVGVLVVILVVFAVTGVLDLAGFFGLGSKRGPEYMPEDTWLYISVNPTFQDQAGFQHLADIYQDIDQVEDYFEDFTDMLDDEYDIVFEDDIKPWIGSDIGVGFIEELDIYDYTTFPRIAVVAQSRNDKLAEEFIEKIAEAVEDDFDVDDDSYQKRDYWTFESEDYQDSFSMGVIDGYLVAAFGDDAMEDVIDTRLKDKDSLAKDPEFNRVSGNLPKNAFLSMVYDYEKMDFPVDELMEEILYYREVPGIEDYFEALESMKAGWSIDLTGDGVQFEAVSIMDPDDLPEEFLEMISSKASPQRILQTIPADSLAFISGNDLAGYWSGLYEVLGESASDLEYQIEDLSSAYGMDIDLDIDEDMLSWAEGEHCLILLELDPDNYDEPVGGVFIQEVSDQDEAEGLVEELLDIWAALLYTEIDFDQTEIAGTDVYLTGDELFKFGYGFTNNDQLLLGFSEDAFETILEGDFNSIRNEEYFKQVSRHLPGSNTGYFYVNLEETMERVVSGMDEFSLEDYEDTVEEFVDPIKAFGFANTGFDQQTGVTRSALYIYIP